VKEDRLPKLRRPTVIDTKLQPSEPVEDRRAPLCSRINVEEIARRLDIGRLAVYEMLEQRILPGVRVGRRWIVTRRAYDEWERTCGMRQPLDLLPKPEVTVN
jgi:excisionase family DNA binding protein